MPANKALHSTQNNNETFRRYAPYTSRDMAEKLICSPRKMPFNIQIERTKFFGDMPLIGAAILSKSRFASQEKCPSIYKEEQRKVSEICPLE